MTKSLANDLLGYPRDARLLILNADDLGMYPDVNAGIFASLQAGLVRSTSIMMPCPAAAEAAQVLVDGSQTGLAPSLSIHLTLVSDLPAPFAPLSPPPLVPSLVDASGKFYRYAQIPQLLARAKLEDVETEFRAQIEAALEAGLQPDHLDWHCLYDGGRRDIFDLSWGLAREYSLALRVGNPEYFAELQAWGLPTADYPLLDSFNIDPDDKPEHYLRLLRELPAGLNEWAVHPSTGSPASQVIDPDGWRIRFTDYQFLVSPAARQMVEQEGIILLDYQAIADVWVGASLS